MNRQELLAELSSMFKDETLVIAHTTQMGSPAAVVKRAVVRTNPDGDEIIEDRVFCVTIGEMRVDLPSTKST